MVAHGNVTHDNILDITTWNPDGLQYRPPRRNAQGGYTVYIGLEDKPFPGNPFVQFEPVRTPFGANKGLNDDKEKTSNQERWSIECSFDDINTNQNMKTCKDFIDSFDDTIIDGATVNCQKWFGKDIPKPAIEQLVRRNVRASKNPQYADTVRFRIPWANGKFTAKLYDVDENEITWDRVGPNSVIIPIVTAKSIWFVNKMFGTTWEIDHAVLVKEAGGSGFTSCKVKVPSQYKPTHADAEVGSKRSRDDENDESDSKRVYSP